MSEAAFPDQSDSSRRWEYRVHTNDSLPTLLERIRHTPSDELFLDISHHPQLRQDGALRRTLAAAAADMGKRVTFSLLNTKSSAVQASAMGASTAESKKTPSRPSGKRETRGSAAAPNMPIPVNVTPAPQKPPARVPEGHVGISFPKVGSAGKRIAITFAFFAGILATLAALFLAPRAEIILEPAVEPVSTDVMIRLSATASVKDIAGGVLPARILTHDELVERTVSTEHFVERGEPAKGTVELVNRTGETQRIRKGSRLATSEGLVFRTQESASVPPNGTTPVLVMADEGGTRGNLQSGELSFVALPGANSILFARIPTPLTGGTDKRVPLLSEQEVRRAGEALVQEAKTVLQEKLSQKRESGTFMRDEFFRVVVLEAQTEESIGSEVAEFHLRARLRGEYLTVAEKDLTEIIGGILSAKNNGEKVVGMPVLLSAARVEHMRWEEGLADLSIHVENVLHERIDIPKIAERLAGRTQDGAEEYLRNLPGVKDVHLTLRPFWVRRVPAIARNVQIEVKIPGKTP